MLPQRSVPKETECTILLGRALAPVEQIVGSWKALVEGRAALRRLRELLETVAAQPERMALPPPEGALEASGLILRSGLGDRLILAGVSLNLAVGESLAVIGPSGAGKSSLVLVLAGLWRSHGGSVRLDGVDLSACDRARLGPHIGYVPQDVKLSAGTVAENIARLGEVEGGGGGRLGACRGHPRNDPCAAAGLRHAVGYRGSAVVTGPAPAHRPGTGLVR